MKFPVVLCPSAFQKFQFGRILFFLIPGLISCSLGVKPAIAPTDPPTVDAPNFKSSQLRGQYLQSGAPTLFLWPTMKVDDAGEMVPMSFDEKALARQKISAYSEEVEIYTAKVEAMERKLFGKYLPLTQPLEKSFTESRCFSYCDPIEDFLCDPTDDSVLFVDVYIESENAEEQDKINQCMENQSQRQEIKDNWDEDRKNLVNPLLQKAGAAGLALLEVVGDNYFTGLSLFRFEFFPEQLDSAKKLHVDLQYGDHLISSRDGAQYSVTDLNVDSVQGFLSFRIPAIKLETGEVYGDIFFDLELNFVGEKLKVEGDIVLTHFSDGKQEVGRFSSNGTMVSTLQ